MELQDSFKQENDLLKNTLTSTNAEKLAIDQLAINMIKEVVGVKTQLILLQEKFKAEVLKRDTLICELTDKLKKLETPVI